jgi:Domain of unknown function (DUF4440)
MLKRMTLLWIVVVTAIIAQAQQGHWAAADDASAKFILDAEQQWEEAACNHNKSPETILADDFWGTAPDGTQYGKADEIKDTQDLSKSASECHISSTKVRLIGNDLALVYGNGFSVRKGKSGREESRCLTFTDTWLKRSGKWQIVAAHDIQLACSKQ